MCEFRLFDNKVRTLFMDLLLPHRNRARIHFPIWCRLLYSHHTSTLFRTYSIQKSIGKIKQTCLFTDNLIGDPTYHKNHLAGKVSKWCFLVQYSGVTVTKTDLALTHLIRVCNSGTTN